MKDLVSLLRRGLAIKAEQKKLSAELEEINQALISLGSRNVSADGVGQATVIIPAPKFAPEPGDIEEVRDLIGDDAFKKLFDRAVVYTAKKAARHIAPALLTPAKLDKFLAVCEKPLKPYVIWPK